MKQLAPLVVFAFNRVDSLGKCMSSLLNNEEAKDTDLYVFVDGSRANKTDEKEKVEAVREFVRNISGFKTLHYSFSEKNKGLGPSVIDGVTEIINQYGRVIVVEDDLVLSTNFLGFMNKGLEEYENEKKVISVCGYTNLISVPEDYKEDVYFCVRSSSWGWATWKDRWEKVDWELSDWNAHVKNKKEFCKWGGSDCWKMLNDWHNGKNQSWAIRFCYSQFLQNAVSLFPVISKVANEGFDGEGTNCKSWSRFKYEFDSCGKKIFRFPNSLKMNSDLYHDAISYHSFWIRLYSRIMYLWYDIKK